MLTVGLRAGDTAGALSIYSRSPVGQDASALTLARAFAAHAALAVAHARERESLTSALQGRNLIGQAQGILMARYEIGAEQAFDVLRRYSSHGNRKLRSVAEDVVQQRGLPGEPGLTGEH